MNQSSSSTPHFRVAIVAASWHRDIVSQATDSIRESLAAAKDARYTVEVFEVPGAFEIPLHAKRLAKAGFDAVIACAFVVNGGIYRHEFVASAVIDGLMRVQLDTDMPVFSVVLTPHDFHEHEDHRRFFREHFVKKGAEAAQACAETLAGLAKLPKR